MGKPTYALFLDLRKAYDTVWRDGLLYKLWNMGIRGKVWQYVDALYARSERAVCLDGLTSDSVQIDLGLSQGDTLSCILFNLFVNDLITDFEAACQGVTLPLGDGAPGGQQFHVSALMFADDFSGLAETREQLQAGIDAARAWCDRWRMQAIVGPTKTAVMLFAPAKGQPPLAEGDLVWGSAPLPVVRALQVNK